MNKKYYILLFFVCLLAFVLKSQDNKILSKEEAAKILQHTNSLYTTTPTYSFSITHTTYAGHTSIEPYEKKAGYFRKFIGGFHSYMLGIHSIQNKNYLITIDSSKKIIIVSNPLKNTESTEIKFDEYIMALKKCTSVKIMQKDKTRTMRLEFEKKYPVSVYEFKLGKEGFLESITAFYAREIKSNTPQGMVKPKLTIVFGKYASGVAPEKNELSETNYFAVSNEKILLKDSYKTYTLLDQRIKNDNP